MFQAIQPSVLSYLWFNLLDELKHFYFYLGLRCWSVESLKTSLNKLGRFNYQLGTAKGV